MYLFAIKMNTIEDSQCDGIYGRGMSCASVILHAYYHSTGKNVDFKLISGYQDAQVLHSVALPAIYIDDDQDSRTSHDNAILE